MRRRAVPGTRVAVAGLVALTVAAAMAMGACGGGTDTPPTTADASRGVPQAAHGAAAMAFQMAELARLLPGQDETQVPAGLDYVVF
ncbi:MAG: hypothetical protein HOP14_01950, partial [Acidobacteria bacterium]|nr:hypothetical protein [Acidobacteriota bacterium]